ncbi:MAG TPA: penicillin-insensitive murein endopeptidase [Geminicoccaceae bacterium]|nr:penicillin-insensitive murein endopeptidase [Geminicoccus sp.]HMU48262.1 penicillin-insensitive murein endopeptidase [Geminicoccaceae bacterium]
MLGRLWKLVLPIVALGCAVAQAAGNPDKTPAKELFGAVARPAPAPPSVVGTYAKGCIAGAQALPIDGPAWQAMRLSRNRNWGHPKLVAFIERLANDGRRLDSWPGLLVGDMAQPRGGPMRTGHASHQIGLDVDLWLTPMPDHVLATDERETLSAISMLAESSRYVDPRKFTEAQARIIRRAAKDGEVERIFVHPGIKQALCLWAGEDRSWLRKVRPWWGHDAHFHVRLSCPPDQTLCRPQDPAPAGDGCDKELDWWLSDEPWKPAKPPAKPPRPMMLADLPASCRDVLLAR